ADLLTEFTENAFTAFLPLSRCRLKSAGKGSGPRLPYELLSQAMSRLRTADGAQDRASARTRQTRTPQSFAGQFTLRREALIRGASLRGASRGRTRALEVT